MMTHVLIIANKCIKEGFQCLSNRNGKPRYKVETLYCCWKKRHNISWRNRFILQLGFSAELACIFFV